MVTKNACIPTPGQMVTEKNMLSYARSDSNQKCMLFCAESNGNKKDKVPYAKSNGNEKACFPTPSQVVTQNYLVMSANCNLTDITCFPTKLPFFLMESE